MTTKLGTPLDEVGTNERIKLFYERFQQRRIQSYASNVPYACALDGILRPDIFQEDWFLSAARLYAFFEHPVEVFETTPDQVIEFTEKKEEWEDYDFCLFDESMNWCVCSTHNGDLLFVAP